MVLRILEKVMSDERSIGGGDKRALTTADCWCVKPHQRYAVQHQFDPSGSCMDYEPVPEPEDDDNFNEMAVDHPEWY